MIGTLFEFGNEMIEVRVDMNNVYFRTSGTGGGFATIEQIQLSKQGVIKEFPDLKDNTQWREEAIKRFKDRIKSFPNETKKMNYVIEDLTKWGYKPLWYQKQGFRPQKIS